MQLRFKPAFSQVVSLACNRRHPCTVVRMFRNDLAAAKAMWIEEAKNDPKELRAKQKSTFLNSDRDEGMVVFHSLRHSFGTMLAASGVHPKTAQQLMRHSDINLTMSRYCKGPSTSKGLKKRD